MNEYTSHNRLFYSLVITLIIVGAASSVRAQDPPPGLADFRKKVIKYRQEGNQSKTSKYLNKIAFMLWDKKDYSGALDAFTESAAINKKIGNKNALATIYQSIGLIHSDQGKYRESLSNLRTARDYQQQLGRKRGVAAEHINMATTYALMNQYQKAIAETRLAMELAQEIEATQLMRTCYGMLAEYYENTGNTELTFKYFNLYSTFEKKLNQQQIAQQEAKNQQKLTAMELRTRHAEQEKKATQAELQQTSKALEKAEAIRKAQQLEIDMKELALKEQETRLENEQLVRNQLIYGLGFVAVLLMLTGFGFMVFHKKNKKLAEKNKEINEQAEELLMSQREIKAKSNDLENALEEIKKKNSKITDSINYAKRIQEASLPQTNKIQEHLPDSFVFFRPRDMVSGDFYWFHTTEEMENDFMDIKESILISAVDCTGHGIPGAFMSLIGIELLNNIASTRGIVAPDRILNELHKSVQQSLRQEDTENRDGMDMGLCLIHPKENSLVFAGAHNPMVLIQDGKIQTIKADKQAVGGRQKEKERRFTAHHVEIDRPTWVYLYSDGFPDQFGGAEGRKFMSKKLKRLLLEIHQKPMAEQKDILAYTLDDWKGNTPQVDDILVIGFKLYPWSEPGAKSPTPKDTDVSEYQSEKVKQQSRTSV